MSDADAIRGHVDDEDLDMIVALGAISEALEWVERARGRLYDFHQMIGRADLLIDAAAEALEDAGSPEVAREIRTEIVGRNVLPGRWTFQVVDEFDDHYYAPVRELVRRAEELLGDGRRHVYEAAMKEARRTPGRPGHARAPSQEQGS